MRTPKEDLICDALKTFVVEGKLPASFELEPGAFINLVAQAWRGDADRDGRKGYLSDEKIAQKIRENAHRPYSRAQYLAAFGDGKRAGVGGDRVRQPITRDIAKAYLTVAFSHWSMDADGKPIRFVEPDGFSIERGIEKACEQMFARDEHIYCRPSVGQGPFGLFEECGRRGASVIVATQRSPVVMGDDPVTLVQDWLRLMRDLFCTPAENKNNSRTDPPASIHIWAIPEPLVGISERGIKALYGIGNLGNLVGMVRDLANAASADNSTKELWQEIEARCVIAIKKDPRNTRRLSPVTSSQFIEQEDIFPVEVPSDWYKRGVSPNIADLNSIVRVSGTGKVDGYYVFTPFERYPHISARLMDTPGDRSDENFGKLYRACLQFIRKRNFGIDPPVFSELERAEGDGWEFMPVTELPGKAFPISEQNTSTPTARAEINI